MRCHHSRTLNAELEGHFTAKRRFELQTPALQDALLYEGPFSPDSKGVYCKAARPR